MTTWIELLIVALVLAVALAGVPWRRVASALGAVRVVLVLGVAALVTMGQFSPRPGEPYPATRWSMYTRPVTSLTFAEVRLLRGVDDLGPIPVPGATEPRPFLGRLLGLATEAADGADGSAAILDASLRELVADLDPPPDRIVVRRCTVEAPTVETPRHCVELWTTLVDDERTTQ